MTFNVGSIAGGGTHAGWRRVKAQRPAWKCPCGEQNPAYRANCGACNLPYPKDSD